MGHRIPGRSIHGPAFPPALRIRPASPPAGFGPFHPARKRAVNGPGAPTGPTGFGPLVGRASGPPPHRGILDPTHQADDVDPVGQQYQLGREKARLESGQRPAGDRIRHDHHQAVELVHRDQPAAIQLEGSHAEDLQDHDKDQSIIIINGPAGQYPADIGQLDATAAGKSTAWPKTSRPRSSKPARRGVPRHAGCHIAAHGQGHPGTIPPGIQPGGAQPHPPNDIGGDSACAGKAGAASTRRSWCVFGGKGLFPPKPPFISSLFRGGSPCPQAGGVGHPGLPAPRPAGRRPAHAGHGPRRPAARPRASSVGQAW